MDIYGRITLLDACKYKVCPSAEIPVSSSQGGATHMFTTCARTSTDKFSLDNSLTHVHPNQNLAEKNKHHTTLLAI